VLGVDVLHIRLGEVRVQLNLVYSGHDLGLPQQIVEVVAHEVADPDRRTLPSARGWRPGHPLRMRAFCCSNSSWVNTPA
jgi:hypothetical protein